MSFIICILAITNKLFVFSDNDSHIINGIHHGHDDGHDEPMEKLEH